VGVQAVCCVCRACSVAVRAVYRTALLPCQPAELLPSPLDPLMRVLDPPVAELQLPSPGHPSASPCLIYFKFQVPSKLVQDAIRPTILLCMHSSNWPTQWELPEVPYVPTQTGRRENNNQSPILNPPTLRTRRLCVDGCVESQLARPASPCPQTATVYRTEYSTVRRTLYCYF
jgi:hypothetical protein